MRYEKMYCPVYVPMSVRDSPVTTSPWLRRVHTSLPVESLQNTTPLQPRSIGSAPSTADAAAGLSVIAPSAGMMGLGGGGGAPGG